MYYREVEPLGTAAPSAGMKNKRSKKLPPRLQRKKNQK
jgi:hypothetical protein